MEKHSVCVFCDGGCPVKATIGSGRVKLEPFNQEFPAICSKALLWEAYCSHPDRITKPLKNIGTRDDPRWQEVSWNDALDEIADRLMKIVDTYGAEAFACSETPLNTGFGGITRRFMNCLGSPNYISPVLLCMGNTAQIHRTTYGWFTLPDWEKADVIIYFGQNRGMELWPVEFLKLQKARDRGAKLIVIDPRITETSRLADYHIRLAYGTDAAFLLGMLSVIIEEGLYDRAFVEGQTVGFEDLRKRVAGCSPQTIAGICDVSVEAIRETARTYANAQAAIIPWGVVGDMQKNSTSVLRCQCILRAICGFLGVSEMVTGPSEGPLTNSQISEHGRLSEAQKQKQLGNDCYPLFSYKGLQLYDEIYQALGMEHAPDLFATSCVAHPGTLFKAMKTEKPYPVKAFFSVGNNTVMSYAGQHDIIDGFMNQELVVTFEHFMTPTAQLSDFVLPGDAWIERDALAPQYDFAPINAVRQKIVEPPGECKDWYFVIKGLADRMGLSEAFPWNDSQGLFDYILSPIGKTWSEVQNIVNLPRKRIASGSFQTPSGKVELKSSILEALGHDPLPYYKAAGKTDIDEEEYPFTVFAGARETTSYNTNWHQVAQLRKRGPEPELFINGKDALRHGIEEGLWVRVSTLYGDMDLLAKVDDCQPEHTLRVPHGWWKPEMPQGLGNGLSGACKHNDGLIFSGDDWNLDREQGLPNLRGGIRAKIAVVDRALL